MLHGNSKAKHDARGGHGGAVRGSEPTARERRVVRVRVIPILITLVTVGLAVPLSVAIWKDYMAAPWTRLAFDQGALHAPGHGLRFFQAHADQVVRLSALEGSDLRRCRYSRFVLNDQLNPHLHIDSRRPN